MNISRKMRPINLRIKCIRNLSKVYFFNCNCSYETISCYEFTLMNIELRNKQFHKRFYQSNCCRFIYLYFSNLAFAFVFPLQHIRFLYVYEPIQGVFHCLRSNITFNVNMFQNDWDTVWVWELFPIVLKFQTENETNKVASMLKYVFTYDLWICIGFRFWQQMMIHVAILFLICMFLTIYIKCICCSFDSENETTTS